MKEGLSNKGYLNEGKVINKTLLTLEFSSNQEVW
jgi:hypothetical protein